MKHFPLNLSSVAREGGKIEGVYACRTSRRDCHYWYFDCTFASGCSGGP